MEQRTDGQGRTGYGSTPQLAQEALERAQEENREYVQYTVPPTETFEFIWNHYGDTIEENS